MVRCSGDWWLDTGLESGDVGGGAVPGKGEYCDRGGKATSRDKLAWNRGSLHLRPWSTGRQVWEGRRSVMVGGVGVHLEYGVWVVPCSSRVFDSWDPSLIDDSS